MKKVLISVGHILSIVLIVISVTLAIGVMVKPHLLTYAIEWFHGIILSLGRKNYLLMGGIGFIESIPFINMAIPGQTFMILVAGFISQFNFLATVLIVVFASIIGDTAAYWIGRYKGNSILRHYGPTFGLSENRIQKLKDMTHTHAHWALFASKWNSYTRGLLPFIAGTSHMSFWDFMMYNVLGAIVYGSIIVVLANLFIGNYNKVVPYIRRIGIGVIGIVVIGYLIRHYVNERKTR